MKEINTNGFCCRCIVCYFNNLSLYPEIIIFELLITRVKQNKNLFFNSHHYIYL
jgi:hypothetical protein